MAAPVVCRNFIWSGRVFASGLPACEGAGWLWGLVLPFQRLGDFMGIGQGVEPWVPVASPAQRGRALLIARTIAMAAKNTPWVSNCFPQALVACLMLRLYRIPHAAYLGLARTPGGTGLAAHAWVACDRIAVSGGVGFHAFTVVGMFVPRFLAADLPARGRH